MNKNSLSLPPLLMCIILDLIGCMSFSIPFVGEFSDIIWAPLSGFLYYRMFGGKMGIFGGAFSFLEEIIPFTDVIPTFTISWIMRSRAIQKQTTMLQVQPKY